MAIHPFCASYDPKILAVPISCRSIRFRLLISTRKYSFSHYPTSLDDGTNSSHEFLHSQNHFGPENLMVLLSYQSIRYRVLIYPRKQSFPYTAAAHLHRRVCFIRSVGNSPLTDQLRPYILTVLFSCQSIRFQVLIFSRK